MATRTTKHQQRVAASNLSTDSLLNLILRERAREVDVVPPGFYRVEHYCEEMGMHRSRVSELLHYAEAKGLVERKVFKVQCGAKRYPAAHYRRT